MRYANWQIWSSESLGELRAELRESSDPAPYRRFDDDRSETGAHMRDAVHDAKLVAFIFSPLQALNLVEYSQRFDRQVDLVVVGGVSALEPTSRTQIEAVLSLVSPRKIMFREWGLRPIKPISGRSATTTAVAALRANLSVGPYEFVVGEYRSAFSWAVLHRLKGLAQRVVVVDDGTAMLKIDRRRSVLKSSKVRRQKLKALMFLMLGIRGAVSAADVTFFTAYAIGDRVAAGDTIVHNDYRTLSAKLRELPPDEERVYVIGTPHRESGVVRKDDDDVELALDVIRFAIESTGKEAVYMAHRRERAEKLSALREEVTVVTPDVPFEIYPLAIGKRPLTIVGYSSSLFVTAAELLGDSVEIIALQIPRHYVSSSWLSFVDGVYRYYRTELATAIRVVDRPMSPPGRQS